MSFQKFRSDCEKLAGAYAHLLEYPPRGIDADLALPCFAIAKEKRKDPVLIAKEIAETIKAAGLVKRAEASGPYVNFYADWEKIGKEIIGQIIKEGENFGRGAKQKEKVMVEFAHPNTHKLFHIGHLRNIATGEAVSRILEFAGNSVIRANYQGDVGLHIAKCLYGLQKMGMKKFSSLDEKTRFLGEAYAKGSKLYEEDEKAKKEIVEINKRIYEKDKKILKLWKTTRKWSLDYFDRIYRRVDTKFDRLYFESEVAGKGLRIAKDALKKGILIVSDSAVIFDGKEYELDRRVFINKLGFPTYEAKELGLAELEFSEFGKIDKCIHVVGPEQSSFFKVTFKVEELLNQKKFKGKQFHLVYGWVNLKEGKMSSRLGKVVEGEWLLEELKRNILEQYLNKQEYPEKGKLEIAEAVAVAAAKYYMLKIESIKDILFDAKQAINLEGDTGPYIQYTYARAKSIMRKAKKKSDKKGIDKSEIDIIKKLSQFSYIVKKCAVELKPNYLATYLFELATLFNAFYHTEQVIGSEKETELLTLVEAVSIVLKNGLKLLGINTLERM